MTTFDYPGSVDNFRAFMESLLASWRKKRETIWTSSSQEIFMIYYDPWLHIPARDVWGVIMLQSTDEKEKYTRSNKCATIMALETFPNRTTVTFVDGKEYYSWHSENSNSGFNVTIHDAEVIGDSLIELANVIDSAWKNTNESKEISEPITTNLEEWFDYYYAVKPKLRIKMEYIANKTGYALSTIYKEHTNYKNSHGIQKRKATVRKSKKK